MRIVPLLIEKNLKIATAESCTGGLIAAMITSVGGASACFETGVVTYANAAKQKLIGVTPRTLAEHGAVSARTAREMCEGVLRLSGADLAVSVTGIAGPGGGTTEKPVGLVYVGVSGKFGTKTEKLLLRGSRGEIRNSAARQALQIAEQYIVQYFN
jgi:nicotinamide-nucleotide amidase